jgi:hypothetical protein
MPLNMVISKATICRQMGTYSGLCVVDEAIEMETKCMH